MNNNYVGSLKGSAASEVAQVLEEHMTHHLAAKGITWEEDGEVYTETFPALYCKTCDVIILELDE